MARKKSRKASGVAQTPEAQGRVASLRFARGAGKGLTESLACHAVAVTWTGLTSR
eukprot:CAMPEP_0197487132 /NCGR_PEP_ID=MMETSP1311-20131121/2161_1 /TAXON_ID=464262 /ORGANISM="Genus nov. species nov., Strain RCC856" /LENGTH=54 /DNA_ID=CAMNT_0043030649 /DNA_START=173 /DNA_END=334 /DNA_ORIENTATION=-